MVTMLDAEDVVLVVGVGEGLGKEVTRAVLGAGGRSVLADIRPEVSAAIRDELDPAGESTLVTRIDVADNASCEEAVSAALKRFGRLDGVVHVAAVDAVSDSLMDGAVENWPLVADVNIGGPLRVVRAATPALRDAGGGSVVVVGSTAAWYPNEDFMQTSYGISKRGLQAMTHYLSRQLGPFGIRVNDVAPGYKMGPVLERAYESWAEAKGVTVEELHRPVLENLSLRRFAHDVDVANAILFFLSPLARNVTGQTLYVDAGQTLH